MPSAARSAPSTTRSRAETDLRGRARQATLACGALAGTALIALFSGRRPIEGWSIGSAYIALFLLAVSLALGPLNLLRRRPNPVHSSIRRDVGIAAGISGLVHTLLGLQVHMGGRIARYFLPAPDESLRGAAFLTANYLGLGSALVLAFLVAISNNRGVRTLGLARWKKLQRLVYVAAAAALLHGFLYQISEKRNLLGVMAVVAAVLTVVVMQIRGMRLVQSARPPAVAPPPTPVRRQ